MINVVYVHYLHLQSMSRHKSFFFFISFYGVFILLFIQYYSVTCRPSDHTVGRPRAEIRTRAGRPRGRDTTPRPPHLLARPSHLLKIVQYTFLKLHSTTTAWIPIEEAGEDI